MKVSKNKWRNFFQMFHRDISNFMLSWAVNKIKQLENEILELKKVISDKEK